ncbi:MAG: asparaginase domain-containing protein [Calditrichaceae bacterium]
MKKILIIHTGGTFGMTPIEPDEQLAPGNIQNQILQYIPEIQNLAEIDVVIPFNLDSSNIGFREWEILSDLIHNNIDNYEGFVVIHGTDTMVYSASALSFSLRAFDSPNYPLIGEIGINIQINYEYVLNPKEAYFYEKGFSNNLSVLSIYPSLNLDNYLPVLDSEINGIILRGFGAGHLPTILPNWMDFLKNARDKNIMIFIGSHSRHGSVNLDLYESGKEAKDLGAISLDKMTIEAAYVKLMRIFHQTTSRQKVIEVLRTSWAGEI